MLLVLLSSSWQMSAGRLPLGWGNVAALHFQVLLLKLCTWTDIQVFLMMVPRSCLLITEGRPRQIAITCQLMGYSLQISNEISVLWLYWSYQLWMGNVSLRYSSYDHDSQHPPQLNWLSVSLLIHKLHSVYVSVLIVDDYVAGQIPGMPQSMPGVFPGMFPFGGTQVKCLH